jgi:MFS family permease
MSTGEYRSILLGRPDFRRLFLARLISFGGDWFLLVPLLGLVYEATGSAFSTGWVMVANSLPGLFLSPFAGSLADRFDRRRLMLGANLVAGTTVLVLSLLGDRLTPAGGLLGIALVAASVSVVNPSASGGLPNLVSRAELSAANVLMGSSWGTMAAVGAALGGVVAAAFSRPVAFAIDAATFFVGAILVARIRTPLAEEAPAGRASMLSSVREGLAYAWRRPQVRALLTSKAGFAVVASGPITLLAVASVELFGRGDDGTGFLFAARGLGALIGPFLARRWFGSSDGRLLGVIGIAISLWGVGYAGFSWADSLWVGALFVVVGHLGGGSQWALSSYGLQALVPDHIRGRVVGLDFAAMTFVMAIVQPAVGAIADRVPLRPLILALALLGILFGIAWKRATDHLWEGLD